MPYSDMCVQPEDAHVCPLCPEDLLEEFAGVGQAGYIRESYLPTVLASPTSLTVWEDGIASGDIIPLPDTRGSYDPGTPKELPGYGRRKFSYGAREMTLNLFEKFNKDNLPFWSNIHNRTDLVPYFVTSSLVRIFDQAGVITAGDPVSEDIEEIINFSAVAKIVSKNLPSAHSISAIAAAFKCPANTTFRITTQPTGGSFATGGSKVLTVVVAGGTTPYSYVWYKDNVVISGATAASYTATTAGTYKVVATDNASTPATVTSNNAIISITSNFGFSTQPTSQVLARGENFSLTASVQNAAGSVTRQWQKFVGGSWVSASSSNTNATGLTAATLNAVGAIANVNSAPVFDEGQYRLMATDGTTTIYSNAATVSVLDSKFTFVTQAQSDTGDDGGSGSTGLSLNTGSSDPNKSFACDKIDPAIGTPSQMVLKLAGVVQLNVNAPSEYFGAGGKPFRFVDGAGTAHYGVFTTGDVNL